jgi:hypothetical protein
VVCVCVCASGMRCSRATWARGTRRRLRTPWPPWASATRSSTPRRAPSAPQVRSSRSACAPRRAAPRGRRALRALQGAAARSGVRRSSGGAARPPTATHTRARAPLRNAPRRRAAGTSETCDRHSHMCVDEFTGNTMGQAGLDGRLMFLHSNMHKWDARLPEDFDTHYQRRWAVMLPGALAPACVCMCVHVCMCMCVYVHVCVLGGGGGC